MKKRSLKAIQRESDTHWSHYIKRDQRCFLAGVTNLGECKGNLEAAHLIARSQSARIRYHTENGIPLCTRHHMIFDNKLQGTLHKLALDYVHGLLGKKYAMLEEISREKTPVKYWEWEDQLDYLRKI